MVLGPNTTKTFHRILYAGMLEAVTVLKRDNDQRQGVVRAVVLYQCRRSQISKQGYTIQNDMLVDHKTIWHVPRTEMDRTGIPYFNPLDRFVDKEGRYWQPEADQTIHEKLFSNHICVECIRVDPPALG